MEREGKYHSPQSWKEKKSKMAATQKRTPELDYFVHETSFVDKDVTVEKNTKIWHFCHILPHTRIGKNCSFGQNCVAGPNVTVGNGVKVQNNVSIYEGVEIEDDVFLGPSMVFTNVINPRAFIVRKREFKKTLIKRGATVGANATVVCGVTIGEYAMIGAGAVITKNVPDFALMAGVPAKQIGWVSKAGNRLAFDENGEAADPHDGSRYRLEGNGQAVREKRELG
jgi:UDP-2-acetamido-3-amino-2,3-dideoxy-glucuronate N-acetyltransferase